MSLTIWKQVQLMRRQWPNFHVIARRRNDAQWEGQLQPLCQTYTVHVSLSRARLQDGAELRRPPCVTDINPLLRRRAQDPSEPIPHHYTNQNCTSLPILCLYDPDAREWHPGLAVAKTVIPWTIDWLACYEGWLATGNWTGGGRHPAF